MTTVPDVAVIGGGIAGCAAAAFLTEAGAAVRLYERDAIAAGASGRNSGLLQHPFDAALVALHEETLAHHAANGPLPALDGMLLVGDDPAALDADRARVAARFPELGAEALDERALAAAEPALAAGLTGYRVATGRPIPPASATRAFADRAARAGAQLRLGAVAVPAVEAGRVRGVEVAGAIEAAGAVLVAAGPWTSAIVDPSGAWAPVLALWGLVVELELERPPRHPLEEAGITAIATPGADPGPVFSLITAGGRSSVGSTFTADEPDAGALASAVLAHAARFVPSLAAGVPVGVRACARPRSRDERPVLGPVAGIDGLHVATGFGPWGISIAPACGRLVADELLGRTAGAIAPEFAAARFGPPPSATG